VPEKQIAHFSITSCSQRCPTMFIMDGHGVAPINGWVQTKHGQFFQVLSRISTCFGIDAASN
jgi:hypothetical protein